MQNHSGFMVIKNTKQNPKNNQYNQEFKSRKSKCQKLGNSSAIIVILAANILTHI